LSPDFFYAIFLSSIFLSVSVDLSRERESWKHSCREDDARDRLWAQLGRGDSQ